MAADPFGGAVDDDVGAVVDGAAEVAAGAEGVVDDEGDAGVVGDLGQGDEVGDRVLGVADGLDEDGLGLVVDGGREVGGVVAGHEFSGYAQAGEEHLELVVGTAVERGGRHDVVTGLG